MTATRLLEYLAQPANLYQLSYQELKTLCLNHPQSATLQYLLYQKSRQDGHADEPKHLQRLAVLVPSREALFHLVRQLTVEEPIPDEDILELIPLDQQSSKAEEVLLEADESFEEEASARAMPDALVVPEEDFMSSLTTENLPLHNVVAKDVNQTPYTTYQLPVGVMDALVSGIGIFPEQKKAKKKAKSSKSKKKKKTFTTWLEQNQAESAQEKMRQLMESKRLEEKKIAAKLEKKTRDRHMKRLGKLDPKLAAAQAFKEKKRKGDMPEVARRSIEQRDSVVSETLAKLLARQGNTEAAIEMYEKLALRFPGKSTYFAAKIDELKSNLP